MVERETQFNATSYGQRGRAVLVAVIVVVIVDADSPQPGSSGGKSDASTGSARPASSVKVQRGNWTDWEHAETVD
ncbi:hypothetical protein G7046_g1169 [Stylonectria norvegica]|nr:hypothetical protein G7046_g1169 [Stylonectria norvegica]